jgi:formylmethanofuran dehydrogenase subunit B
MTPQATQGSIESASAFVCPFCGLLCDDLPIPAAITDATALGRKLQALCPRAAAGVEALAGSPTMSPARIDGREASLDAAIGEAARRLRAARRPVIAGLAGDVQSARAALALGDRIGARMIHCNQYAAQRNLFAVQSRGALTTTLAEVRQRAEMIVLIGKQPWRNFPRLFDRLLSDRPAFADRSKRRLILLGASSPPTPARDIAIESVHCGGLDLLDCVSLLRASRRGLPLPTTTPDAIARLAERMSACAYGVVVWAAGDLDMDGGDFLVEQLHQLVIELNGSTRWAALPLAGNEGDLTANAVSTWQTGFALPIEFGGPGVRYDPFPDYADADLIVWLGAIPGSSTVCLPGSDPDLPRIVLGTAAVAPQDGVFIAVATPGVSSSGHLVRTDGVITLYAPAMLPSSLPTAATVIERIGAVLSETRA